MNAERKRVVLFLCTGNSCRSQMAEALLRRHGGGRFEVHSAGTGPHPIAERTKQVMAEVDISLDGHRPKHVDELLEALTVDYLITVCSNAEETCPAVWPRSGDLQRLHWPFDDPAAATGSDEDKLALFRRVRDQIDATIRSWLAEAED